MKAAGSDVSCETSSVSSPTRTQIHMHVARSEDVIDIRRWALSYLRKILSTDEFARRDHTEIQDAA